MLNYKITILFTGLFTLPLSTNIQAQTCNPNILATTPNSEFTDNGDGTITHSKTGLMWAKCPLGLSGNDCAIGSASTMTWDAALNAAQNLSLAGFTDWRLPNKNELASLQEKRCYNPEINSTYFPNTPSNWFWTSSQYKNCVYCSWIVLFSNGFVHGSNRGDYGFVRCVRMGQWLFSFSLSINKLGSGLGTITSNPEGINCGAVCAANFAENTAVTLTATPAAGSAFGGWSSNCAGGQVNMTADTTCTATFNLLPKPDFTIPVMTIAPAVPVTNGTFTATVTVKNQGTIAADGGQLRLWANQATAPTCAATGGDKNVAVGTIAAGVSTTFTIPGLNAGVSGLKTLRAFVDATCAKAETNETNNQRTLNYRVAGRKPDLVITNITLTPAAPAKNTVFNAAITIKNQGSNFAGGSFLDVWTNQATAATCGTVGNAWADIGGLAAGASTVVNVTGLNAGATAGAKTLRAFVDSWCEEVEGNETNNQLTKSYTVQ